MGKTTQLRTWIILSVGLLSTLGLFAQEFAMATPEATPANPTPVLRADEVKATITGTVTNSEGEPLEGVTVLVKGTTTGALTDSKGQFSLNAPDNAEALLFSYFGYDRQEVAINGRGNINVTMIANISSLDEVVVVGYGTQERRVVTGSISSIGSEALEKIPVGSGLEAMQGQVAGVDVVPQGGRPGQAATVQIRGRRSISASNDPLIVIDGIPMTTGGTGSMFDINPQDIESMEVLKDAASTSIYGSRGANGVILITTKRGKQGKTSFSYDGYVGQTAPLNTVDMMNGEEFAAMKRESRRRDIVGGTNDALWNGQIPSDDLVFDDAVEQKSLSIDPIRDTDYQDLILGTGTQQNHQLSVRGGNAKTLFNVSLGLFDETGVISNQDFRRISTRVNIDHNVNNRFKIGTSTMISRSVQNWGSDATLGEAIANNPLGIPYEDEAYNENWELVNPDPNLLLFLPTNDGIRTNPLSELVEGAYIDERVFNRIFPSLYAELELADGLTFRSNVGTDIRFRRQGIFRGSQTNSNRGGPASAQFENNQDLGYTWENILNYSKTFGDIHSLNINALQSIQANTTERHESNVSNLP
ncbi:MAG: SusC/RagA family TonB-linked outer membrane protein, partial [Bacteroidota bacterium]